MRDVFIHIVCYYPNSRINLRLNLTLLVSHKMAASQRATVYCFIEHLHFSRTSDGKTKTQRKSNMAAPDVYI